MTDLTDLTSEAMLVNVKISQWSAKKYDRKVSEEVANKYQTSINAGRYNKDLLHIATEKLTVDELKKIYTNYQHKGDGELTIENVLKEIKKTANEARTFHYENTLPWTDEGFRILTSANFDRYSEKMRELKNRFEEKTAVLFSMYPILIGAIKEHTGGLLKLADYPNENSIRDKFGFSVDVSPIPMASDFRVNLGDTNVEKIRDDITKRLENAQANAMKDLWTRLYTSVNHMVEKLSTKNSIFRDSLVGNICELCDLLPRLNIANDKDLDKLTKEIEEKLCRVDPQDLRDNDETRKDVAKKAKKLTDKLAGFMG